MSRLEVVAVLLVLALSLALRLASLDVFIASDELKWTCRSLGFREALMRGDWAGTFRVGHPGVITTWLGTLALPRSSSAVETCRRTDDAQEPSRAGETPQEQTQRLAELGRLLFRGRIGVALFTWLSIAAIYLLARTLWGPEVALPGLALVALDPFYLAHSRFLHLDAVLASAMTLSLLSLLISVRGPKSEVQSQRKQGVLVLSGALGGLAMLNKSPGMFLVPFVALLLVADALRRGGSRKALLRAARDLGVWLLAAGVVYVALWPALWSDPMGTVARVLAKAIGYAEEGHESGNFFLGRPVDDPGPGFYPLAALFRLSPLALIGLIAALPRLVKGRDRPEQRFSLAALLLYSLLFGAFMTLGAKKFDRYLLPVFPALDLVAAAGLFEVVKVLSAQVDKHTRKQGTRDQGSGTRPLSLVPYPLSLIPYPLSLIPCFPFSLFPCLLISLCTAFTLPHHPYYLTCYNPLLGGLRQAQKVLLVGWGEGYDRAAAYLNAKPEAQHLQATVRGASNFAPLFSGETRPVAGYRPWQSDYVVFYISQVQRLRNESLLEEYVFNPQAQPEQVVTLHGVDYAWIYANTHYLQPMSYIEEHGQPGQDLLLVNGGSLFAKHYQGELPLQTLYTHWGLSETVELLDSLPPDRRVWYARYPDADPQVALDLLESRGVLLDRKTFPTMEVSLYRRVGPETARHPLDLRFGDLRLVRYGLTDPALAWGQDGGVVLEWEALRPLEEDYTAFLHLRDSQGHLIVQGDKLITDESLRPTSQWETGTLRLGIYRLPIPPSTPPGRYELEVGVYLLATGERLPLLGPDGSPQGTAARLEVEVGASNPSPTKEGVGE
jgi:4-amino-4-deoxy-L-arabinose transferase-like glycosyltransferase